MRSEGTFTVQLKGAYSGHWAGLDLVPMIHESAYGALSRFAQRNVLSFRDIRALMASGRSSAAFRNLYLNCDSIERRINDLTGWRWSSHEARLAHAWPIFGESAWSDKLRFCPICLEAGFHSVWYQFETLSLCPMHECKIVDFCLSCGVATSDYEFSADLLGRPYACGSCGGPIAGAIFDLDEHLDLRAQHATLVRGLDPVRDWFDRAAKALHFIGRAAGFTETETQPCSRRDFILDIAHKIVPFPDGCSFPAEGRVTVLPWRLATLQRAGRPAAGSKRQGWGRYGQIQGAYRATLRLIRRLIASRIGEIDPDTRLEVAGGRVLGLHTLPPLVLSYLLLRFAFEKSRSWTIDWRSEWAGINEEPIAAGYIGEPMARLCVRGATVAVYAAMVTFVLRARTKSKLELCNVPVNVETILYRFYDRTDTACSGFVAFPTLDWLAVDRRHPIIHRTPQP
jgi:hypothetical protein